MTSGVVLIGPPEDHQVQAVDTAIRAVDGRVTIHHMSPGDLGAWSWSSEHIVTPDGLQLTECASVYIRSIPYRPPSHREEWVSNEDEAAWLESAARFQRAHGFFKSVQLSLDERGVRVVNPLWGYMFHRSKPTADLTLAAAGVPVPEGVATSDPELVEELIDRVGEVVFKPVAGGGRCRKLDPGSIESQTGSLEAAPVYFQQRVIGQNLRVYTIGAELLAAFLIESDDIDFRGREGQITVVHPSEEVKATAVRAAHALGLIFVGCDIKLLPDGSHVVLDVNPSPMFAGLDRLAGNAIATGLARYLMGP